MGKEIGDQYSGKTAVLKLKLLRLGGFVVTSSATYLSPPARQSEFCDRCNLYSNLSSKDGATRGGMRKSDKSE